MDNADAKNGMDFKNNDTIINSTNSGEYYFCIYVQNTIGGEKNICSNKFKIDNIAPSCNLSSTGTITGSSVYFPTTIKDPNGSGVAGYMITPSSVPPIEPFTSNEKSLVINSIGSKTIYGYVIDKVGNIGSCSLTQTMIAAPSSTTFNATGAAQTYAVPGNGIYTISLYGAQGTRTPHSNAHAGGKGAYVTGSISLTTSDNLNIYVGTGNGSGAFNGGGTGNMQGGYGGAGGGATDLRLNGTALANRIMVAGGGGGGGSIGAGGIGGALTGGTGIASGATGGTQTSGGIRSTSNCNGGNGILGTGGIGCGGGGGGGYYGGGGSHSNSGGGSGGGGGGSSYISGYSGCVTHTSGRVFTNPSMIAGNKSGNGQAIISFTSVPTVPDIVQP